MVAENWIPSPVDLARARERADLAEGNNFPFVLMGITELRELCDLAERIPLSPRAKDRN